MKYSFDTAEVTPVLLFFGFVVIFCFFPVEQFGLFDEQPYSIQEMRGWTVHLEKRMYESDPELASDVISLLDTKLMDINRMVSEEALDHLHQVPIWVDLEAKQFPGAVYHPSEEWLEEHDFNPEMAKSVHIANATNFVNWTKEQPAMVMHEMAHAYHHQVLGHDHPEIKRAYQNAKESKSYAFVLRYNGKKQKAYAMNNEKEYFAELSEAFFGTNDFYPFVRAEIQVHDPVMYEVLQEVWKEGGS